jgi:hypothetical protein
MGKEGMNPDNQWQVGLTVKMPSFIYLHASLTADKGNQFLKLAD